jgi:hypothetical protein
VSTGYVYAAEALAEGRGLLAEFDNPESIAHCVNLYLDDPTLRHQTEQRALAYGREMAWTNVGAQYASSSAVSRRGICKPAWSTGNDRTVDLPTTRQVVPCA